MGCVAPSLDMELAPLLREQLSAIAEVESVRFAPGEKAFFVWVGLREDEPAARRAVYAVEDAMSERFPNVSFDFHIIPLPPGRGLLDFVSASGAQDVFHRIAA